MDVWFLLRQTLSLCACVCVREHMLGKAKGSRNCRKRRLLITQTRVVAVCVCVTCDRNHMILIKGPAQLSPRATKKKLYSLANNTQHQQQQHNKEIKKTTRRTTSNCTFLCSLQFSTLSFFFSCFYQFLQFAAVASVCVRVCVCARESVSDALTQVDSSGHMMIIEIYRYS